MFVYSKLIVRYLLCLLHELCQISDSTWSIRIMYFLLFIVIVTIIVVVPCIFVQTTTVGLEKNYLVTNKNCMKDFFIWLNPSSLVSLFVIIWLNPPSFSEMDVFFEWPPMYIIWTFCSVLISSVQKHSIKISLQPFPRYNRIGIRFKK